MAPLRKNVTQATVATPTAPKRQEKTIDTPELVDRWHSLSDVHIFIVEDSHSNSASLRGV